MNSENKNDFKRLLHTMLPLVLAQLSLMGMNVMDATMSGHAGPVDLAGVSMGASLFMPVTASFTGILAASTPMIAQLLGRRRKQDIPHVVRTGMALGMLLTALGYVLSFTGQRGGSHCYRISYAYDWKPVLPDDYVPAARID